MIYTPLMNELLSLENEERIDFLLEQGGTLSDFDDGVVNPLCLSKTVVKYHNGLLIAHSGSLIVGGYVKIICELLNTLNTQEEIIPPEEQLLELLEVKEVLGARRERGLLSFCRICNTLLREKY